MITRLALLGMTLVTSALLVAMPLALTGEFGVLWLAVASLSTVGGMFCLALSIYLYCDKHR